MKTADAKREAVAHLRSAFDMSERRACKTARCVRMTVRYRSRRPDDAKAAALTGAWIIEIVKRSDTATGFEVLPKRWIVERTIAWISRCRRLARDFERYGRTVAAFIRLAMIRIMLRRLTRSNPCH